MEVNLLPKELKPKKYIVKISKTLTSVALIALLVFITSAVVVTGVFFIVSNRLSDTAKKQEELTRQIHALEETEQKIVLIKDRLGKIDTSLSKNSASEKVDILESVIDMSEGFANVDGAELSDKQAKITVIVDGSLNLTKLLANMITLGGFKKVEMLSFKLNRARGFELEFGITR